MEADVNSTAGFAPIDSGTVVRRGKLLSWPTERTVRPGTMVGRVSKALCTSLSSISRKVLLAIVVSSARAAHPTVYVASGDKFNVNCSVCEQTFQTERLRASSTPAPSSSPPPIRSFPSLRLLE